MIFATVNCAKQHGLRNRYELIMKLLCVCMPGVEAQHTRSLRRARYL